MANTSSAKKATRVIARRTEVNKSRRSRLRTTLGKVEEAFATGDRAKAAAALKEAEPIIMRASQTGRDASQRGEPEGVAAHQAADDARQVTAQLCVDRKGPATTPGLFCCAAPSSQRMIRRRLLCSVYARRIDSTDGMRPGNRCCISVTRGF